MQQKDHAEYWRLEVGTMLVQRRWPRSSSNWVARVDALRTEDPTGSGVEAGCGTK